LDRFHDVLVAGATAEVARNSPTNVFLGRMRFFLEQGTSRHDHAGRAEPALKTVFFFESLLQRVQSVGGTNPLNCTQFPAIGLNSKQSARFYGSAIQQNCAGATIRRIAADMRSGQREVFPDKVNQQKPWFDRGRVFFAIHLNGNIDSSLGCHKMRYLFAAANVPELPG
jgi:hypothetical protein